MKKGERGFTGVAGPTGSTGPAGVAGPQGEVGPAGADGADGEDGMGVPTGGVTGQLLAKIDATNFNTEWIDAPETTGEHDHDTDYAPLTHDHDDLYYTETEVDTAFAGKSDTGHTHTAASVTDFDAEVSSNTDVAANTAARHTHTNSSILAATTASFTTADETAIDTLATTYAPIAHDHDADYATVTHAHDDLYYTESEIDTLIAGATGGPHDHDAEYAAITHDHDDLYYTEPEIDTALAGKASTMHDHDTDYSAPGHDHDSDYAASVHDHDDEYYTEAEIDTALALKSDTSHTHSDLVTDSELSTALSGKADSVHTHDDRYFTETEITSALANKSDTTHDHDNLYYTESEMDTALSAKSNATHDHDADYSDIAHTHTDLVTDSELSTALAGKANSVHAHDDLYFTEAEVTSALALKSDTTHDHDAAYSALGHNHDTDYADIVHDHDADYASLAHAHDDLYFTEAEVTTALAGKSDTGHAHTAANVTDFDAEVSNNTDVAANTAARHTHANSAVLSATTASFTTADETKLDGIEALADVTDAANVDAAGAVMNADTSTASMSFVIDEDNMTTNTATKVPTQQSTKAYVDTGLATKAASSHTHGLTDLTATGTKNSTTFLRGDNTWATPASGGTFAFPFLSGRSYGAFSHGTGGRGGLTSGGYDPELSLLVGKLYCTLFYCPETQNFNKMVTCTTSSTSGNFRMGIYTVGANNYPGSLVIQTADITASGAGSRIANITSTQLTGGTWYYLVLNQQASGSFYTTAILEPAFAVFGDYQGTSANENYGCMTFSFATAALPSTWTDTSPSYQVAYPIIGIVAV